MVINDPNAQTYRYVSFPKLNILNKQGRVANYKSVYGNKVVIEDDGNTFVVLKKKDGNKFFGYLSTLKANYNKSIALNEMSRVN